MDTNSIKFKHLSDSDMRSLGFQDMSEDMWVYVKDINTKGTRRHGLDYSFNLFLNKDLKDFQAEVVNNETGSSYDFRDFVEDAGSLAIEDVIYQFLMGEFSHLKNAGVVTYV